MNGAHTSLIRRDEVVRQILLLRNRLDEMTESLEPIHDATEHATPEELYLTVEAIIALRRRRRIFFRQDLFGEPAWDMLLELFRDDMIDKVESVSSICFASGVPATTALRWLTALERAGLVRRIADEADRRKVNVCITDRARECLKSLFIPKNFLHKRVQAQQS